MCKSWWTEIINILHFCPKIISPKQLHLWEAFMLLPATTPLLHSALQTEKITLVVEAVKQPINKPLLNSICFSASVGVPNNSGLYFMK